MGSDAVEGNYEQIILDMLARIKKLEGKEVYSTELSDMSSDLGLIEAGEFRAHADYLEPKDPGEGFSGVRIVGEGIEIDGVRYSLVGYNNDTVTIGLSSETGEMFFCNFNAVINQDGITGTDLLKWMIKQTATQGAYTRTGKLGMELVDGVPSWLLSYTSPAGSEIVTNGGAESGDFTSWTETTGTNTWSVTPPSGTDILPNTGDYAFLFAVRTFAVVGAVAGVLTSDRYTDITAGLNYTAKCSVRLAADPTQAMSIKGEIKWYDHVSAGSLIQTDVIIQRTSGCNWTNGEIEVEAPTGALSFVIVLSVSGTALKILPFGGYGLSTYVFESGFDDVSVAPVTVATKLWLADDGVHVSNLEANYSPTLKTNGRNQNGNTTNSYTFMWFPFITHCKIKLNAVLWDCRNAATYTCTLRDYEDNVLATSDPVVVDAGAENVVFDMGDYEMSPRRYKLRLTRSSAGTWYTNGQALFACSEFYITDTMTVDNYAASTKAPVQLRYYNESP